MHLSLRVFGQCRIRRSRFKAKHMDSDALVLLSESVPPADLSRVGIFRACVAKFQKKVG